MIGVLCVLAQIDLARFVNSQGLIQAGESVNLRIRSIDCTPSEGLAFVREGVPVARPGEARSADLRATGSEDPPSAFSSAGG